MTPSHTVAAPRRRVEPLVIHGQNRVSETSLLRALPGTPLPRELSELAGSALELLRWLERPVSVLELAARMDCVPTAAVTAAAELLGPLDGGTSPGLARQVHAPSHHPASRLRAWTGPDPTEEEAVLHHDLWLVVAADQRARRALGPLAQVGPMPLSSPDTTGALWYGACVNTRSYTSLVAMCALERDSAEWSWLTRAACGAMVIAGAEDPRAAREQAQTVRAHHVPLVVLVETGACEDTEITAQALGLAPDTPVVHGSAAARCDLDEAALRLEDRR